MWLQGMLGTVVFFFPGCGMCPAKIRVSVMQGRKELKSLPERKNVGRGADWGGEGRSGEFLLGWMSWAGDHLLPSSLGLHHCAVLSQQLSRIHILLYHRAHVSHSRVTGWGSRSYWVPTPWGWAVIISQLLCGPCDFFLILILWVVSWGRVPKAGRIVTGLS